MGRKKHEEHENHERWLVSYADFITLLFAFFTVLYATAQSDQSKLEAVVDSMTAAFEGGMPAAILDVALPGTDPELNEPHISSQARAEATIKTIKQNLIGSLSDNVVQIGLVDQILNVVLPEKILFAAGSAVLHPASYETLSNIAAAIKPTSAQIEVLGHADGTPITGGPYLDNWGLATARAITTVRFLQDRGIPMNRLTAVANITPSPNPEARAISFRIRMEEVSPTAEVLHRLYPEEK